MLKLSRLLSSTFCFCFLLLVGSDLKAQNNSDCLDCLKPPILANLPACTPTPAIRCGDGIRQGAEQCDDGNTNDCDNCNNNCQINSCGDGRVQACRSEACDDGNTNQTDGCRNCRLPACGDGIRDAGEACDDGNLVNGDLCSSACTTEQPCAGVTASHRCSKPVIQTVNRAGACPSVSGRVNFYTYSSLAGYNDTTNKWCCFSTSCLRPDDSFHPSAKINLANGQSVRVDELKAGDLVLGAGSKPIAVKQIIEGSEEYPFIELKTANSDLKVTRYHLIQTEAGIKQARFVKVGDKVTTPTGNSLDIIKVSELPMEVSQKAYGVILDLAENSKDEDRLFYAEGILVGDYTLEVDYRAKIED